MEQPVQLSIDERPLTAAEQLRWAVFGSALLITFLALLLADRPL